MSAVPVWLREELGPALRELAGPLAPPDESGGDVPPVPEERERLDDWIDVAALRLGVEAEPSWLTGADLGELPDAAPCLARVPGSDPFEFVVLLGATRRHVSLLTPTLRTVRLRRREFVRWLEKRAATAHAGELDAWLDAVRSSPRGRTRARRAVWAALHGREPAARLWMIRRDAAAPASRIVKSRAWLSSAIAYGLAHAGQFVMFVLAWRILGPAAFHGTLSLGQVGGWALALFSMIPCRMVRDWSRARLLTRIGVLLRQRALAGILRMDSEELRRAGVADAFGRVIDIDAIENQALSAGFLAVNGAIEIVLSAWVLSRGAAPLPLVVLLGLMTGSFVLLAHRMRKSHARWNGMRLALSEDLAEKMIGHRTRLAQGTPETDHVREDEAMAAYHRASRHLDRYAAAIAIVFPRLWMLLGLSVLIPVLAGVSEPSSLAYALGGILLGFRALDLLGEGVAGLAAAYSPWQRIRPLLIATGTRPAAGLLELPEDAPAGTPILDLTRIGYRYPGRPRAALQDVSLQLKTGERALLVGPSGGGKSTLASLAAGLRDPDRGVVRFAGFDRSALGDRNWRRGVALTPQFHENHLFADTLAFNLLLARRWPPSREDLLRATEICRELGLGPLLQRMPAGLQQRVGDGGWRLSHGERSRVFLARALLQGASVLILDESFAALDAENVRQCVEVAKGAAPTLLVIAHP
ncbi:MAG: ABC transporter ATP-binding protein [bacterium]